MFTDEIPFFVQGCRKTVVRRSQAERLRTEHQWTVKRHSEKVFWGCFISTGPGSLVPIEKVMNSEKYIGIIKCRVVPAVENNFPNSDGVFQDDLAHYHTFQEK